MLIVEFIWNVQKWVSGDFGWSTKCKGGVTFDCDSVKQTDWLVADLSSQNKSSKTSPHQHFGVERRRRRFKKRYIPNLCIRSQIQILIRHNFFHTEYFLLKFPGSLELFLKRSIPVRFCSNILYLVTRNFRNVRKLSKFDSHASEMGHHTLNFPSFTKRARN